MRKTPAWLVRLFLGVMVFFCLFLTAFVLLRANLTFQLADLSLSLETSRGRERKQQVEYDQVQAKLPLTRAELEETQPLADAAVETVRQLKEERKGLRAEKKELETAAAEQAQKSAEPAVEETAGTKEGAGI